MEFAGKLKNTDGINADGTQSVFVLTTLETKQRNTIKTLSRKSNSLIKDSALWKSKILTNKYTTK